MEASGICTVIHAIHIGRHDILVMFDPTIEKVALSPWNTSICNENVKAAIKFLNDLVDYFLDVLLASDVYLICSACGSAATALVNVFVPTLYIHLTPYSFSMSWARSKAFLFP